MQKERVFNKTILLVTFFDYVIGPISSSQKRRQRKGIDMREASRSIQKESSLESLGNDF